MRIPKQPPSLDDLFSRQFADYRRVSADRRYLTFARECDAKYRHWDKVRLLASQQNLDPELAWMLIKMTRLASLRDTPFLATDGRPIQYGVPDVVQRELMLIDQQLAGRITFEDERPLSPEHRDRYVISALMDEAIASSQVEGAATTRRVAKEMLRKGRRPRDRSERMIVNNYHAITFIRENDEERLSPEYLLELQRILTHDTLDRPDEAGRLRTPRDRVQIVDQYGEVLHDPPPADELPVRIESICRFANQRDGDAESFIHPFVRATLLHFQIAYDHPFCDGNGRTARAVFYWSMLRSGYWMFEFLPISPLIKKGPARYGRAFLYTETDDNDATYFLAYHTNLIRRARSAMRSYLLRKQRELDRARSMFSSDADLNHRQRALLLHALRHPDTIYTIESHQNSQGVSYATARSDLFSLAEKGYLVREKRGLRYEFISGDRLRRLAGLNA